MRGKALQALGDPDIWLGGLSLWVRSREFPEAPDFWDGNWLHVVGSCKYPGARVEVDGPFLRTEELARFADACVVLHRQLDGEACLNTLEPNLRIVLRGNGRGRIHVAISISPDHLNQRHSFEDEVDQTDLAQFIACSRAVLERFPTIGAP